MTRTLPKSQRIREALDHAELALRGYDAAAALHHTDAALMIDPGHREARLMEARAHMMARHPRETLRALDAHDQYGQIDIDPKRIDTALMRAASLAQVGKTALAIAQFEQMSDLVPEDLSILRSLSALQLKDGRDAEALETLTLICDADPSDRVSARALSVLLANDAPSRAVDALGKIGGEDRLRAARLCRDAGRWQDAERHYDALLLADESQAWLWLEAGTLAIEMGELIRAEERLREAVLCAHTETLVAQEAWSALAVQWMRRGRAVRAGTAWWRAVRSHKEPFARGWAGLLTCATRTGRENLMRKADRELRSQTTRAERRALIAAQWLDLTPDEFAEAAAQTGDRAPAQTDTTALADVINEALETLQQSTARFPGRADVRYHHAVLLEANHDKEAATHEALAALAINPAYRAAQTLCSRIAA